MSLSAIHANDHTTAAGARAERNRNPMSIERDELAEALQEVFEGGDLVYEDMASALTLRGYRKPQQVTTVEELDALPYMSIVLDGEGTGFQKNSRGSGGDMWAALGDQFEPDEITLPATVLHNPEWSAK